MRRSCGQALSVNACSRSKHLANGMSEGSPNKNLKLQQLLFPCIGGLSASDHACVHLKYQHVTVHDAVDMASACERAFQVPELFDLILFNLPIKSLVLCRQVCKTWHDLINQSARLQWALFLSPVGSTVCTMLREREFSPLNGSI